jgi:stringent starvation protein B
MPELSTKPYLIRALHEWCTDSGHTPYLAVKVDHTTSVPHEFVRNGEIVLNLSVLATNRLKIDNELISFQARFAGVARELLVPIDNVLSIYARETGQGMKFEAQDMSDDNVALEDGDVQAPAQTAATVLKPTFSVVENDAKNNEAALASGTDISPPPPKGGKPTLTRIK